MNAGATVRMVRISWVLLLAALVVGVLSAHEAEATKNTGKYKVSISKRVGNFTEGCEDLGGTADVSYSYDEDDNLVSANASCSGGDNNGRNCTFTLDDSTCYQEPNTVAPTTRPIGVLPGEDAVVQNPDSAGGSGVVRTEVRSPGVADAGVTEPSTPEAASEPSALLIAAKPAADQMITEEPEPES